MTSPVELHTTKLPAGKVSAARTRLNRILIAAVMVRERQINMIRKGQDPRIAALLLGDGPDHPAPPVLDLEAARASRARLNKVRNRAKTLPANHPLLAALARAPETSAAFGLSMYGRYGVYGLEHGPIDIALLKLAEAIETDIASQEAAQAPTATDDPYINSMQAVAANLLDYATNPHGEPR